MPLGTQSVIGASLLRIVEGYKLNKLYRKTSSDEKREAVGTLSIQLYNVAFYF